MIPAFTGQSRRLPGTVTIRSEVDTDQPFLRTLYASTREDEMKLVDWPREQIDAFLSMQFNAQCKFYREQFPAAEFLVLEQDGESIGRIYLDRREDELCLIDIALLPAVRNHGLGEALLLDLLDEAQDSKRPVRIHVEQFNPAMRLYLRLGFIPIEDKGVYQLLEWKPQDAGMTP